MGSDRVRFERWFRAHHAAVYRFAYRRVGADLVDDVVAETFLTAWRRRDELVGDPLPWLLGVARRVCGNCLRSRTRWTELVSRLARERMALDMAVLDEDVRLGDALRSLSSVDREALILVAWDGLSHAEAAIVVGTNTSAFTVRVHRARTRLAQALGDPGEPCETNLRQAMGTHE